MSAFAWIVSLVSVVGVFINVRWKHPFSYVVWAFTNCCWLVIDARAGLASQAALQSVYLALSGWGIARWMEEIERKRRAANARAVAHIDSESCPS